MHRLTAIATVLLALVSGAAAATPTNPYAGQQDREIKALSADDVQGYLSGKGMGLARAAELNGYPGPSHVLDLSTELALTPDQVRQTNGLFKQMQTRASVIGKQLVEEERALDELFASKAVTPARLSAAMGRIGLLQGQYRDAHLEAHIAQAAVLTPEQLARYQELRGYGAQSAPPMHHVHEKH